MKEISKEKVKEIAHAARLAITDNEVEIFQTHLNEMTTYAEQLNEVDTTGVEPTVNVHGLTNVMRGDEVHKGLGQEDALKNAPSTKDGQFKVPSILE